MLRAIGVFLKHFWLHVWLALILLAFAAAGVAQDGDLAMLAGLALIPWILAFMLWIMREEFVEAWQKFKKDLRR